MTVEELMAREHIRHTLAAYNRAGDADEAVAFANCFTEDGIIDAPGFRFEGRENIRKWKVSSQVFAGGTSGKPAEFRVHHVSSTDITLMSEDSARVRSCWLVVTDIGLDHTGVYHDQFRRTGHEWLIAERLIDVLWRDERSYIGTAQIGRRSPCPALPQ